METYEYWKPGNYETIFSWISKQGHEALLLWVDVSNLVAWCEHLKLPQPRVFQNPFGARVDICDRKGGPSLVCMIRYGGLRTWDVHGRDGHGESTFASAGVSTDRLLDEVSRIFDRRARTQDGKKA